MLNQNQLDTLQGFLKENLMFIQCSIGLDDGFYVASGELYQSWIKKVKIKDFNAIIDDKREPLHLEIFQFGSKLKQICLPHSFEPLFTAFNQSRVDDFKPILDLLSENEHSEIASWYLENIENLNRFRNEFESECKAMLVRIQEHTDFVQALFYSNLRQEHSPWFLQLSISDRKELEIIMDGFDLLSKGVLKNIHWEEVHSNFNHAIVTSNPQAILKENQISYFDMYRITLHLTNLLNKKNIHSILDGFKKSLLAQEDTASTQSFDDSQSSQVFEELESQEEHNAEQESQQTSLANPDEGNIDPDSAQDAFLWRFKTASEHDIQSPDKIAVASLEQERAKPQKPK